MTREEAKNKFLDGTGYDTDKEEMISAVYDDFESRTCENCSFVEMMDDGKEVSGCPFLGSHYPHNGFGCNKWEKNNG